MKKLPARDDYRDEYPNVGYDRHQYQLALEKWAVAAEAYIKKLEHYRDETVGLWATDSPELISDSDSLLFKLEAEQ